MPIWNESIESTDVRALMLALQNDIFEWLQSGGNGILTAHPPMALATKSDWRYRESPTDATTCDVRLVATLPFAGTAEVFNLDTMVNYIHPDPILFANLSTRRLYALHDGWICWWYLQEDTQRPWERVGAELKATITERIEDPMFPDSIPFGRLFFDQGCNDQSKVEALADKMFRDEGYSVDLVRPPEVPHRLRAQFVHDANAGLRVMSNEYVAEYGLLLCRELGHWTKAKELCADREWRQRKEKEDKAQLVLSAALFALWQSGGKTVSVTKEDGTHATGVPIWSFFTFAAFISYPLEPDDRVEKKKAKETKIVTWRGRVIYDADAL